MAVFLEKSNEVEGVLDGSLAQGATALSVGAGQGALFPTGNFLVTIGSEIILVTTRVDDDFTVIVRGQEGSADADHADGIAVEMLITAGHFVELEDAINAAGGAITTRIQPIVDGGVSAQSSKSHNDNTLAFFGLVSIPYDIDVNSITIRTQFAVTVPTTADIALYSLDGATKLFEVTTPSLATPNANFTTVLGAEKNVPAGMYYIGIVINGGSGDILLFHQAQIVNGNLFPSGGEMPSFTQIVTAGTLPATLDPTSGIANPTACLVFGLNN